MKCTEASTQSLQASYQAWLYLMIYIGKESLLQKKLLLQDADLPTPRQTPLTSLVVLYNKIAHSSFSRTKKQSASKSIQVTSFSSQIKKERKKKLLSLNGQFYFYLYPPILSVFNVYRANKFKSRHFVNHPLRFLNVHCKKKLYEISIRKNNINLK